MESCALPRGGPIPVTFRLDVTGNAGTVTLPSLVGADSESSERRDRIRRRLDPTPEHAGAICHVDLEDAQIRFCVDVEEAAVRAPLHRIVPTIDARDRA